MAARNAASGDAALNMNETSDTPNTKDKKKHDTLFGPSIGVINSGPKWAQDRAKGAIDYLSPDIVKGWIAKSKEVSQPTTTLQALVNLRRPTIRLSPLTISPDDDPDHADSHHHHGLEFEFDCDAPKCGISVHVVLPADHPLSDNVDSSGMFGILVFEATVDGGFGKVLKLEEGATLELGRFEQRANTPDIAPAVTTPPQSEDVQLESAGPDNTESSTTSNTRNDRSRKRLPHFHFRKRTHDTRAVMGPALAVVDAEVPVTSEEGKDKESKETAETGVRVIIRLCALDESSRALSPVNEQATYLHIVRFGTPSSNEEEDIRPWVVKVVKREAIIGVHTFHLHEIYGLSSQSSASSQPQSTPPTSTQSHTYPPVVPAAGVVHEDEPSSECLLCLSSPREVVLLPCRHLVACKECAINMVEFGAGGNIVHAEEPATAASGTDGAVDTTGNTIELTAASLLPPLATQNNRRKRKAKGWFCPVCRQPYTSLLRITTTAPTKEIIDDDNRPSTSLDEAMPEHPSDYDASIPPSSGGGMLNSFRPGFLRNISRGGHHNDNDSATLPPDLERGAVLPALAA